VLAYRFKRTAMQEISTLITTVGFPIAMCLLLYWQMLKNNEKHESEVNGLNDTINKNTIVLTELTTLIKSMTNEK